jgi:putative membrane protein
MIGFDIVSTRSRRWLDRAAETGGDRNTDVEETGARTTRRERLEMKRFLIHWLVIALALWVTAYVLPGVSVDSTQALAIAAVVLGLVNALIRPVLTILTLPITILTLGLFYLVINGLTFLLASKLVPGFHVGGFWWAVLGALLVSIISSFVGGFAGDD